MPRAETGEVRLVQLGEPRGELEAAPCVVLREQRVRACAQPQRGAPPVARVLVAFRDYLAYQRVHEQRYASFAQAEELS